jgi:hypothetical protein
VLLPGLWLASPIVAVGELKDVSPMGVQAPVRLPYPVIQDLHTLYWCEAKLSVTGVVKGALPTGLRRYVWGAVNPGCRTSYSADRERLRTKIWFLREEGGLIRPTFDGGTMLFYGLDADWVESNRPAAERLADLLLTPSAHETPAEFARGLVDAADLACILVGKAECARRIGALSELHDPDLSATVCAYLRAQLEEPCG